MENLFSVYVGNFAHYNAVYGGLGAVIAFMFFVYLAADVLLLGAEVASEWPRVRRDLEQHHDDPSNGAPPKQQITDALRSLWVRREHPLRQEASDGQRGQALPDGERTTGRQALPDRGHGADGDGGGHGADGGGGE